jgi:hydroxymethylpyrimidine pyrophosphatase-like HAD family hydrolase
MIILTDIDDTLMRTARKVSGDPANLKVGAIGKNGQPISFVDKKREKLIEQFIDKAISIPVTARSRAGLKNLKINFSHHAVLNFGATIVDKNGDLDPHWHALMKEESESANQKDAFEFVAANLLPILLANKEYADLKDSNSPNKIFEMKTMVEDGIYAYMNFRDFTPSREKRNILKEAIRILMNQCDFSSYYMYETDRDLAVIPNFISKRDGAEWLLNYRYTKDDIIVGLGDHANDLSFMSLCDFIMFPTDSMLNQCLEKGVYV